MLYGKPLKKLKMRKVYKNHLGLEIQDLLLYNKGVMDRRKVIWQEELLSMKTYMVMKM